MRWPFRRRAAESVPSDASVGRDRPQETVASPVDAAPMERAPARQWATLPAISTVVPLAAPLVVGPPPVVPPLRLADRRGTASVEPAVGSVTGIARPVVRATEPVTATQFVDVPPAQLTRRVVRSAPTEVAPLVDAVDEYVGEPREPAGGHRAPGWLRFVPDWAKQLQGQAIPGLPAPTPTPTPDLPAPAVPDMVIAEPPSFLPPELRNPPKQEVQQPELPELPPRVAEGVPPAEEPLVRPVRKRRPNLGQTRRLGLGAPISKQELVHPEQPPPIVDGVVESSQEPPPPPAAPARLVPEPEPLIHAPEPPTREPEPEDRETPAPSVDPTPPAPTPTPPPVEASAPETAPPDGEPPRSPGEPSRPAPPAKPVVATYRATAELRPAPRRERPRATVVDRVPATLANEVRNRQQADVADVPVYRGVKVSEAAKTRGARAFAAGGAVFLPDEAGPTDSPKARGLLAHELVHAVQQRTLGGRLPAPDSPLGQRLEAEAQAAERFYGGQAGAVEPAPLIHAPTPAPPQPMSAPEPDLSMAAQLATELAAAQAPAQQQQPLHSPFDAPTTAEVGRIATESARHVVQEWTNPALQQRGGAAGGQAPTGAAAAAGGHAPGGARAGGGQTHASPGRGGTRSTFNADAYRQQLLAAAVATHNAGLSAGQPQIGVDELSPEQQAAIERQVEAEAGRHGVTVQSNQPPAQHYEPNSADGWMHAITGMNMNYGSGWGGWRKSEPVGSERSWYGSETGDKRPTSERIADQLGLINADTDNSFAEWFQAPADNKDTKQGDAGDARNDPNHPATHEDSLFGRPNPDRSAVDINKIDLDELATRLYDRLRSRLRTELLVDRERAGLLTDFR
jgi:Domain of unknown function (DUF4157)